MQILRTIAAIVIGVIVAILAITIVETINGLIYSPSPDKPILERMEELQKLAEDRDAMKAWVESLPIGAMAMLQIGWGLGAFLGGGVSALIAGRGRMLHAGIIGVFILAATIANLLQLKAKLDYAHPDWLIVTGLLLPLPLSLLAGKIVSLMFPSSPGEPVMKTLLAAMVLLLSIATSSIAAPLKAGAARIDITPPVGFPMWGYAVRKDAPSTGVRDPLYARAVVLAVGDKKIALVGLDLGRAPTRASMANIRKQLKTATGIDTIFLVASHTHHGPVLELDDWPSKKKPYVRDLEAKIVRVIADADKKLQPAKLGIASHEMAFNRNRHSKRPDRPVDKEILIARIDTGDGKPIAHLVHFAAHPTMLPARLREFSADFPGVLTKHVEKELGGICVFLQGAAGDLSPNPPGPATPEKFGEAVGMFVVEKSKKMKCDLAAVKVLKTHERDFKFRSRLDISNPLIYAAYAIAFFPS